MAEYRYLAMTANIPPMRFSDTLFRVTPPITLLLFLLPVALGLIGTWIPAFGYFPAIGETQFSLKPWVTLFNFPGFESAVLKTFVSGLGASFLALFLMFLILVGTYPSRLFHRIEQSLSTILSVPHAAFAIGFGFLLMPSGWLFRALSQVTPWFESPPIWTTFQDPTGMSLALTLALKELPFLLFMALAVLPSLNVQKTLWLMQSLGHTRRYTWAFIIFPQLYRQIKLPFFAVVAYSLTVVDLAIIAGPTTPGTLAVLVTQRFEDPFLASRLDGAAGATLLLLIVILTLFALHWLERPLCFMRRWFVQRGSHHREEWFWEKIFARFTILSLALVYVSTFFVTLLWSFTKRWQFPDLLPESFYTRAWQRVMNRIDEPFWCTFWLAILSSSIAIILVIISLQNEVRLASQKKRVNVQGIYWIIYIPLIVPQIAFLFGFQVSLIRLQWDGSFLALLWSHLIFVFPYVFLTLSGPFRRFDQRYIATALSLNSSRWTVFWKIKLAMLLRPILYAFATGFSVSIAQYLPTLFIGAGKFTTLTTEAVAMTSGSDRRMMAVMAIWQQSLPLLTFALATILPFIIFRHRRAMR